ncbi:MULTISPECIES: pseudouridine synthase [unclassified Ensifer]|uniref:pseudouridine synthase n=1 Tax=unclassified Ensifer TaxID=2633371 RepID=UPI00081352C6|nr:MULTISPECIES: pseudouridine synthase [unclassified Ensifer]OCP00239.1 pseudouridine synthase [Ensifer sp. LC14]OCP07366.1 pseudouridine synthase [Ensifer sp. LC11]OCP08052.1 pseudouridine synthase [Ensifer sp. LC13]OCP31888.1 pseudouridine synthase [Ensifer sp. LC499]
MTSKDKPTRPGGKSAGRDKKPHFADKKSASPKNAGGPKASGFKASGPKPGASRPAKERPSAATAAADEPQRISKILARAGVASRRDVERMIMEGRIKLNGVVLDTPVVNATLADAIEVDDQPIRGIERTRLWLYHKPAGLVTTNADPEGRPTVFENLPEELPRVLSIGRLDINTEGLLLLTNDGGLARVLELPSTGWLRRYRVRAHGEVDQADLDRLKDGIAVDGVLYGAIEATLDRVQGSNVWITMGLREGKNREIKNVLGALGLDVNRLIRISYGPFQLGELPEGHVQEIRGRTLRDQLGPRLIEDAKANFDAPLYNDQAATIAGDAEGDAEDGRRAERSSRWEKPEDKRERALARLDTRRDDRRDGGRKDGARGKGGPREDRDAKFEDRPKRAPAQRARTANVWMAPGARPLAEKKPKSAEGDVSEKPARRERPEGAPKTKRYGRTKDGFATKTSGKFDPDRKGGSPRDFDRADRPASAAPIKRRDEEGEWISASEPARRGKDEGRDGGFGRRKAGDAGDRRSRDHGDRPARREGGDRPARSEGGPRSYSDKPRFPRADGDRPQRREGGDRPRGDRPARAEGGPRSYSDKPRAPRAEGDRPQRREGGDRPRGDRPARAEGGPRSYSDKPRAPRAEGDRPQRREGGDRPFGDKPRGKSFGGKPSGGKSFGERSGGPRGGKPGGGKPGGGRPGGGRSGGGGRPAGGKPRGRGN